MARTVHTISDTWMSIGSGPMSIEFTKVSRGTVLLNTSASDLGAREIIPASPGWEVVESNSREVFARYKGESGWVLTTDDGE